MRMDVPAPSSNADSCSHTAAVDPSSTARSCSYTAAAPSWIADLSSHMVGDLTLVAASSAHNAAVQSWVADSSHHTEVSTACVAAALPIISRHNCCSLPYGLAISMLELSGLADD